MFSAHEPHISRVQKIAGYSLSILASLAVLVSGLLKFVQNPWSMEPLNKLGLSEHGIAVAIIEVLCVVLYWFPRSSNIGFFLLCSYVGGIMVAEILMGEAPVPGLVIACMVYVGTLLRKPSLAGWSHADQG